MPPDMASDNGGDDERLEELQTLLQAISAEVAQIKARKLAAQQTPEERRSNFTIVRGGIGGIGAVAAFGSLIDWIRRHPAALVGVATALVTAILILTAPNAATPSPRQLSLPPGPSLANSLATTPPTTPTGSTPLPVLPPATSPPEWIYLSAPAPTPSGTAPAVPGPSPSAAAAAGSLTPAPTPTGHCTPCIAEVAVPGVLRLCVA